MTAYVEEQLTPMFCAVRSPVQRFTAKERLAAIVSMSLEGKPAHQVITELYRARHLTPPKDANKAMISLFVWLDWQVQNGNEHVIRLAREAGIVFDSDDTVGKEAA